MNFTDSLSISYKVRPHKLNILEDLGNEGEKTICRKENTNDILREYSYCVVLMSLISEFRKTSRVHLKISTYLQGKGGWETKIYLKNSWDLNK